MPTDQKVTGLSPVGVTTYKSITYHLISDFFVYFFAI